MLLLLTKLIDNFQSKYPDVLNQSSYKAWVDSIFTRLKHNNELSYLSYKDFLILYLMDYLYKNDQSKIDILYKILEESCISLNSIDFNKYNINIDKNHLNEALYTVMDRYTFILLGYKVHRETGQSISDLDLQEVTSVRDVLHKLQDMQKSLWAINTVLSSKCVVVDNLSFLKLIMEENFKQWTAFYHSMNMNEYEPPNKVDYPTNLDEYEPPNKVDYPTNLDVIIVFMKLLCVLVMCLLICKCVSIFKDYMLHDHNHNLENDTVKDASISV